MKMRINKLLDTAQVPNNGGELRFHQRGEEFVIEVVGFQGDLMTSALHDSEDALAELSLKKVKNTQEAHVLIGGLGMGFTLAAALEHTGPKAKVVVAELVPEVVKWNEGLLGQRAGDPMQDPRAEVKVVDVLDLIRASKGCYDAIMLDTDNGPVGLTHANNNRLYSLRGLRSAYAALKPNGILAVWSTDPDASFTKRLGMAGFQVEEMQVYERGNKGTKHNLWFAERGSEKVMAPPPWQKR